MDKRSEAVSENTNITNANAISTHESSFPYDGIFSPHGFLSTIPSSASEDAVDYSLAKVAGQCEDQGQGQLQATKKLKKQTNYKSGTKAIQNNDLPPSEVAFSIDHILENILHFLETSDLLNCRLVCRRWFIIATPELQKIVELKFSDDQLQMQTTRPRLELRQLTRLLKQKTEIARARFPCQKFKFHTTTNTTQKKGNICSTQLKQFLDVYGIHIRSLCIDNFVTVINDSVALTEIRELLAERAPNLKHFSLSVDTSKGKNAELELDTEFKNDEVYKIKSLKTLHIHTAWRASFKVLEGVLEMAPNLEELVHDDDGAEAPLGCGGNFRYSCFRKPWNRLHLLKEIHLGDLPIQIEPLEQIVIASLETPGTLKLRQFTIESWFSIGVPLKTDSCFEMERRFAAVMNHLLECSWDTLETIKWEYVTFVEGLKWGQVMSKVKALRLEFFIFSEGFDWGSGSNDPNLFPPGLSLSTIFPNLRIFEIVYLCTESQFVDFLKHLNPDEEVLNSVTDVRVGDPKRYVPASAEALELLRKFFPKAVIQYPYGNS